jgi:hypothetical protein
MYCLGGFAGEKPPGSKCGSAGDDESDVEAGTAVTFVDRFVHPQAVQRKDTYAASD